LDYLELYKMAKEAKNMSYSPYSNFRVGAAVIMENGKVYTGANIENSSYGATVCAERSAIFRAVLDGNHKIKALAVAADTEDEIFPCGICLQVVGEFCDNETKILCGRGNGDYVVYSLEDLLPKRFSL